jgi:hypothetical protein
MIGWLKRMSQRIKDWNQRNRERPEPRDAHKGYIPPPPGL